MYKNEFENVEVYFICDDVEKQLIETIYDKKKDIHYWYFNAYLAYIHWKNNFKNILLTPLSKMLLIVAASRYLIYRLEIADYKTNKEYKTLLKDLKRIKPLIKNIIREGEILNDL